MRLPREISEILARVTSGKTDQVEFWQLNNSKLRTELYFALSDQLMLSDLDDESIPEAYIWLAYLFYWETNCLFSGWYAIENKLDELDAILYCYRQVGLSSEAIALEKAIEAWFKTDQDHDATGAAYKSVPNSYSDENRRIEYLEDYFSKNAEKFFYVQ